MLIEKLLNLKKEKENLVEENEEMRKKFSNFDNIIKLFSSHEKFKIAIKKFFEVEEKEEFFNFVFVEYKLHLNFYFSNNIDKQVNVLNYKEFEELLKEFQEEIKAEVEQLKEEIKILKGLKK